MTTAAHTAENWPIAAAMLPFGSTDSRGGPIHDAEPEEWAKHLRLVRRIGFTEVDPTDTWVRVADLGDRIGEFRDVLGDVGLTIPAISTSRRSVHGPGARRGVPRLQPSACWTRRRTGVPMVSFGSSRSSPPAQRKALLVLAGRWLARRRDTVVRSRSAALIRELAVHSLSATGSDHPGDVRDTYVGTCDAR